MKYFLPILILLFFFNSCTKNEDIILVKDLDKLKYFPSFIFKDNDYNSTILNRKEFISVYPNTNSGFILNIEHNFIGMESKSLYGKISMDYSYLFNDANYYGDNYQEKIEIIADENDNVDFFISETHISVLFSTNESYRIEMSPYKLQLLRKGFKLNDIWSNTESIFFKVTKNMSTSPTVPSFNKDITFHYKVLNMFENKEINGKNYSDVAQIVVDYVYESKNYKRAYYFALDVGLVSININGKHYEII